MSLLFQRERFQKRQRLGQALAKLVERRSNKSLLEVAKCKRAGISTALVFFPLTVIKNSDKSKLRENRFILDLGLTQSVLVGKSGGQSLNSSQETAMSTGSPHFFHFTQAGTPCPGRVLSSIEMSLPVSISTIKMTSCEHPETLLPGESQFCQVGS